MSFGIAMHTPLQRCRTGVAPLPAERTALHCVMRSTASEDLSSLAPFGDQDAGDQPLHSTCGVATNKSRRHPLVSALKEGLLNSLLVKAFPGLITGKR